MGLSIIFSSHTSDTSWMVARIMPNGASITTNDFFSIPRPRGRIRTGSGEGRQAPYFPAKLFPPRRPGALKRAQNVGPVPCASALHGTR